MSTTENNKEYKKTFARADLRDDIFDSTIEQQGLLVKWEKGMFCSCYNETSGQPRYSCPVCHGKGYVYFDPKIIKAIITSISGRKEQDRIGLYDRGTAYATFKSIDNVNFRDRFTFVHFVVPFSELIQRGVGDSDTLTYPIMDTICVRVLDTIYKRGVDFNITPDSPYIQWLTNCIPEGETYSILYTCHPVYIAINPIHELRGTYSMRKNNGMEVFSPLPKQFQIKREDFIKNPIDMGVPG